MYDQPAELQKVFTYIVRNEYLEFFSDSSDARPFRLVDWAVADIDGDTRKEVFLLINPYFAETAPVQIYQIGDDGRVRRIKEALAPGHPIARETESLTSHIGGLGMDMTQEPTATSQRKRDVIEASMKYGMTVVEFPTFFHADHRLTLGGGYADLSHIKKKPKELSCESIQLARPSWIQTGKIRGSGGNVLAVVVGKELWLYRIRRIVDSTFLDKKVVTMRLPKDFVRFDQGGEYLRYINKMQETRDLVSRRKF